MPMSIQTLLWMVVAFPLAGALVNGLLLGRASKLAAHVTGSLALLGSFLCAATAFVAFLNAGAQPVLAVGFEWIRAGDLAVDVSLMWDRLSAAMTVMVTGVSFLIHVYAGGYMAHEEKTYRFFTYLNLFVFMMLMLVLGNSLPIMFLGWEGVGLCSYLLIGYWFEDDANAAAGMKAFLVNRIGDLGFLVGIFLTYKTFGTLVFAEISDKVLGAGAVIDPAILAAITWITLAFFVGACGKSAQIPLYVWLPDAMAGPTPVSALIHAATMVTAGIYMMTRMNFLFYLAPVTMHVVMIVGAATALMAATIALVQTDIKKVLAYSTVSQLGYMVLACGVGAFGAGVFHLMTHAFFKALLFLGAGSVIVALHHKQEIWEMGGLRRKMPITHATFLIGVLAIIGFPGLAGFFSKDEILWRAFQGGGPVLWGVAVLTAGLTAFYMTRLLCLTFYGKFRGDHHTWDHCHETSPVIWLPLVVLAALAVVAGYFGVPAVLGHVFHVPNVWEHYMAEMLTIPVPAHEHWAYLHEEGSPALEFALMGTSVLIAMSAAALAVWMYAREDFVTAKALRDRLIAAHHVLLNKYFVDEFYFAAFVRPLERFSRWVFRGIETLIIDGIVNGVAQLCLFVAGVGSMSMTGSIHRHGMALVLGLLCLLTLLML